MDDMLAGANSSRLVSSQQAQLSRVVELEIIPRLMLLHRLPHMPRAPLPQVQITAEQVQALTELAADGTPEATIAFVRQVLDDGATQEQVFLDLLAASARLMGEWWEQDLYNFSQVTIGLWRLQPDGTLVHSPVAWERGAISGCAGAPRSPSLAARTP